MTRATIPIGVLSVAMLAPSIGDASVDRAPMSAAPGGDIGVVRVECTSGSGVDMLSRGVVVDTGAERPGFEVILTAAHGLPAHLLELTSRCAVIAEGGRRYGIRDAWRPRPPVRSMVDDWAVLLTSRRMRGQRARVAVKRIAVAARERMAADGADVRLPLLTIAQERRCGLEHAGLSRLEQSAGLFAHTCQSWQGHSGSPILARIDGEVLVIGVHLASRWFFEGRRTVKIGRFIDASVVAAIRSAVREGREPGGRAALRR